MTARSFVWLSIGGGAWSLGANWADTTDGVSPSLVPPGADDSVTIAGPTDAAMQTITGPGQAAAALFTGNTLLSGTFGIAALTLGQASAGGGITGGLLELANAALDSGAASVVAGSLLAGIGASFSVSGSVTLGDAASGSTAALNATGGGFVDAASLFLESANSSIYVDPASIVEVGGKGTGQAGALSIDAGATLAGQGDANEYGATANNGTIEAQGGTLAVGAITGTGILRIDAGATLKLNGACAAGQSVDFAGANATLAIAAEFDAPSGTLSHFAVGDAIDVLGSQISTATYANGTLTLFYGTQVAASLTLAGDYSGEVFLTAGDGAGGTLITAAPSTGGGGGPSPGTSTPDNYSWTAGSGGWNDAANWSDTTLGQTPAAIAPGKHDLVAVAAGQGSFSVLSGPADAAALAITGEVALTGAYHAGTLTIGQASGTNFTSGTLDLLAGTPLAAAGAAVADGAISVSGSASGLSVAGTLILGGGPAGVGLPTAGLSASAGGRIQAQSLAMGGGSGASLTTDPTGSIEIGSAGQAVAGAVTVDAGAMLSGNGSVNPLGAIVDNGTILASGGPLSLGTVSGTGTLAVAAGATLEMLGATACPIQLLGNLDTGGSVLAFANIRVAPTGPIAGLAAGDALHLEGSPLTNISLNTTTGVLTLLYGNTIIGRLDLADRGKNLRFTLAADGIGGTYILVSAATSPGGNQGQAGTDSLVWTNPVSSGWSNLASWTDATLGKPASAPPGPQTPAQIAGPSGTQFLQVTGSGTCSSLALSGNTVFSGSFSTGQLSVQTGAALVSGGSSLLAGSAHLQGAILSATGIAAQAAIAGEISLAGTASLLSAIGRGGILCGTLSLAGGGTVIADATGWIDVGHTAGSQAGAVTIDAGAELLGAGSVNLAGAIIDNGAIVAAGGTLALGTTDGAGGISIGTGATLDLTAEESCPIHFVGAGACLRLDATQITAGTLIGFAAGDAILIGSTPADGVAYQPGSGGIGTLTITEGGSTVATLNLIGNYTHLAFGIQPAGAGAEITLSPLGSPAPPAGTATPDAYLWQGGAAILWANPNNWIDQSAGQSPARLAPGLLDNITIEGGTGTATQITGPGNSASLSLSGTVALSGAFATGTLASTGLLALADGAALHAGVVSAIGGIALFGGVFGVDTTLLLGTATQAASLAAMSGAVCQIGTLSLAGPATTVLADAQSWIEIGGTNGAADGTIAIDAGGQLSGAGSVLAPGGIIDQGTITASGGTLMLASVAGAGILQIGVGATLALAGAASASLTADFAGPGTLLLGAQALADAPAIVGFGGGDSIALALSGATSASYALIAPGIGVVSIDDGNQTLAQLTLLGAEAGLAFAVAGSAGGITTLTAAAGQNGGPGGNFMTNPSSSGGTTLTLNDLAISLQSALGYAEAELTNFAPLNTEVYEWFSVDGANPPGNASGMPGLEVVGPLPPSSDGLAIAMQAGFGAVLLEGQTNLSLTDGGLGHALLVGNSGRDSVAALGEGDTLVGATGASTTFYASLPAGAPGSGGYDVSVVGGGNDYIATNNDAASIRTSNGHSQVFLGAPDTSQVGNSVVLNGADTVICSGNGGVTDNITVAAAAGLGGNLVFGSPYSRLNFVGGATASTVVGNGGVMQIQGGSANGNLIWGGTTQDVNYIGGSGSAAIVAGSGETLVQGGSGPVTVFGGNGLGNFSGAAGSVFVVGDGPTTVQAATGIAVFVSGGANVSVAGGNGADVYAGSSTANNIFDATGGNETLWGGLGNDRFIAGAGHDLLVSGGGDDVFSYTNGLAGGSDTIVGFTIGQDTLALHGYGPTAPTITYAYGDSILKLTDGTQIVVYNVPNLTASSITTS